MGATTSAYWLSWFIWFFMEFTLIAIFVTALGTLGGVFKYSDASIVFVWFELFCLSSATFGMMISTLFDNPKVFFYFIYLYLFCVFLVI